MCSYLMVHLDLTFQQALTFLSSRRKAVCPNEGFVLQLRRWEISKDRQRLRQELATTEGYISILEADLTEVRKVQLPSARKPSRSQSRGKRAPSAGRKVSRDGYGQAPPVVSVPSHLPEPSPEQQARIRAMEAIREAAAKMRDQGAGAPRIGDGSAVGDIGLEWLLKREPALTQKPVEPLRGRARSASLRLQQGRSSRAPQP